MSIVYITNASLNLISKSLRIKKTKISREGMLENLSSDFGIEHIITANILDDIFNSNELKDMYFRKMVLKDFHILMNEIEGNKQIIKNYVDESNKKYAIKVKEPAYHIYEDCAWMRKSFKNIQIPTQFLKNSELTIKVENWISENKNMRFLELNEKFKTLFNSKEDLIEIDRKNSGSTSFDNKKININFNTEVKTKYKQLRFFLDGDFADKLKNYKYARKYEIKNFLKNNRDINSHKTILDFHDVKEELEDIIYNCLRETYNKELKFERTLLDEIGFNICKSCSKSSSEEPISF